MTATRTLIAPSIVLVDVGAVLPIVQIQAAAAALQRQVLEHFAPLWGAMASVRTATSLLPPRDGEWRVELHDMPPPTVEGALGFHGRQPDGTPVLYVFVGLCASNGTTWTSCASHEICEALADPYLRRCVQSPGGVIYALEVCDACEAVSYQIDGVEVSDFCTPAWFEPEMDANNQVVEGQQFDYCGKIAAPFFVLADGYAQTYSDGAGWEQNGQTMGEEPKKRAYRAVLGELGLARGERR